MSTDWSFLEPWHAAICANGTRENLTESVVSFTWPDLYHLRNDFNLTIHVEEGNLQNVIQLQKVWEAIVLFTTLSIVNNEVFKDQFSSVIKPRYRKNTSLYPRWNLYVCGSAAAQQVAWSAISDSSPEFQQAIKTLEATGLGKWSKEYISGCRSMQWQCKNHSNDVSAKLVLNKERYTVNEIKSDFQRLVSTGISLIGQLGVVLNIIEEGQRVADVEQVPMEAHLYMTIHDLTAVNYQDLAAGLLWIPINFLGITFEGEKITNAAGLLQATMNAGKLMNRVEQWSHVIRELRICCEKVPTSVFGTICSALSTLAVQSSIEFILESADSESWPWLVYAVCCGPCAKPSLHLRKTTLTESDIWSIAEVMKDGFPHSKSTGLELSSRTRDISEFGFVDILEGTTVWLIGVEEGEGVSIVVPCSVRCRAWFKEENVVEIVVPRFGLCRSRIGDGVSEVSRDRKEQKTQRSSVLRELQVSFASSESASLVNDLLYWIGRNLRLLLLYAPDDGSRRSSGIRLDLSEFSALCPNLQALEIFDFDVVISDYNSLRLWPIKSLTIQNSRTLKDLVRCMRNPDLRMARELENLLLKLYDTRFAMSELRNLMQHDGDVLKIPIPSKIALVSVVNQMSHPLCAGVLQLVFSFFSGTKRSVRACINETEWFM